MRDLTEAGCKNDTGAIFVFEASISFSEQLLFAANFCTLIYANMKIFMLACITKLFVVFQLNFVEVTQVSLFLM